MAKQPNLREVQITEKEFKYLSIIKEVFKIFYYPSVNLQGEAYTTLNEGLLYIYDIYKQLDNFITRLDTLISLNPKVKFFINIF